MAGRNVAVFTSGFFTGAAVVYAAWLGWTVAATTAVLALFLIAWLLIGFGPDAVRRWRSRRGDDRAAQAWERHIRSLRKRP